MEHIGNYRGFWQRKRGLEFWTCFMQQSAEHRTPTWQVGYFAKVIEIRIKCRRYYVCACAYY